MTSIDDILARIDVVLKENKRIEWIYIVLTIILFGTGIACFVLALIRGEVAWSTPSVITTGLLYWPLREIKDIRAKNIALATAPMLITQLPKTKAAEEIQKLLQSLYGGGANGNVTEQ
ncbi:hypothetical protein [Roseimaritima sediminicola]|uniref:hypothetical protein n=1 Tax=Roseimaritima sediminicola TaxID=2662066 RepID=UPI0012982809|nr:hypothetical protein [Roseimaritima sediminicola]